MEIKELLEYDEKIYGSTHNISIAYFLDFQKNNLLNFNNEEAEIPAEISVYKYIRNIPIIVIEVVERVNGKTYSTLIKGSNEVKNIIKWINGEVNFSIAGQDVSFLNLSDEDKEYIINRNAIGLHRVRIDDEKDNDKLKEIIKNFC